MNRTCLCCGKPLNDAQQLYCSKKCNNQMRYVRSLDDPEAYKPSTLTAETHCQVCGTALKGRQKLFCSSECKNQSHQSYATQQERGLKRKIKLVAMLGGECQQCGYNKNLAALSFHHLDNKSHPLDLRQLSNRSWQAILEEVGKCVLLCANCHMEEHNPDLEMEVLKKTQPELMRLLSG